MTIFWILFGLLMLSTVWGLLTLTGVYDRELGLEQTRDLDRMVREAW
jgi:hypothetical protein